MSKTKRIEKELSLLRTLPKEFKLAKKDTALGTLIYVTTMFMMIYV